MFGVVSYLDYFKASMVEYADNFGFSAILSTIVFCFLQYVGGDTTAFAVWLAFSMLDCVLGILHAVVMRQFSSIKLHRWFLKTGTQLVLILMFAMILDVLHTASGHELSLTNWLVLFFAFFDFSTCIDKLISMGAPVPGVVVYILELFRHRIATTVGSATGASEEDVQRLEDAMRPPQKEQRHAGDVSGS